MRTDSGLHPMFPDQTQKLTMESNYGPGVAVAGCLGKPKACKGVHGGQGSCMLAVSGLGVRSGEDKQRPQGRFIANIPSQLVWVFSIILQISVKISKCFQVTRAPHHHHTTVYSRLNSSGTSNAP